MSEVDNLFREAYRTRKKMRQAQCKLHEIVCKLKIELIRIKYVSSVKE